MNEGKIKNFLAPDLRKILSFLVILVCIVAIMLFGSSMFPVGSSESIFVIPQILLGAFLLIFVMIPFGTVATIFRAFGIDLFYTTGIIAKTGMILGMVVTVFWWYIMSCLVITIYRRLKGR